MKTRADIELLMHDIFKQCQETRESGQKEYAHAEENAFGNFERLSVDLKIAREKVLWIYVRKHLDGILAYINGHQSQREDVRGRIKDVIVYMVLLWGMVEDNVGTVPKEIREDFEKMDEVITRYARGR